MRYIAVHPLYGVFLAYQEGLMFFSALDPHGLDEAPTWADANVAALFFRDHVSMLTDTMRYLPVNVGTDNVATIDACVAAGAPRWIVADSDTLNQLPA